MLNSNQVRDAPCGKPFSELHPLIISPFENLGLGKLGWTAGPDADPLLGAESLLLEDNFLPGSLPLGKVRAMARGQVLQFLLTRP